MSYQVLARKWRPGKFSELVGQEHVVNAISNALDNNRLHHAYLFTGTRGVGKTTIARIFARSLNCDQGMSSNPCGVCNSCKDIEQGNFVDLLEIDAASRTKVEDTRELLDNVQYRPTRGDYKVYLIDEVHMLSKHSFNALLKTLEEPPPHVKFLLATTDPQKLPITILSRCLQFNLKALTREQISGQLAYVLKQENLNYDDAALALLAKSANGSMRDALSLTDQAIAQGNGQVHSQVVADMLGLIDNDKIARLTHAIITKDKSKVFALIEELALSGADFKSALSELISVFHQIALTQFVPEACKLETTHARQMYNWARAVPPEQIQLLYQIALQGRKDIEWAQEPRMGLEMAVLRMLAFMPQTITAKLESFHRQAEVAVESTPDIPLAHSQPEKPVVSVPETDDDTSTLNEPPQGLLQQEPAEKKTLIEATEQVDTSDEGEAETEDKQSLNLQTQVSEIIEQADSLRPKSNAPISVERVEQPDNVLQKSNEPVDDYTGYDEQGSEHYADDYYMLSQMSESDSQNDALENHSTSVDDNRLTPPESAKVQEVASSTESSASNSNSTLSLLSLRDTLKNAPEAQPNKEGDGASRRIEPTPEPQSNDTQDAKLDLAPENQNLIPDSIAKDDDSLQQESVISGKTQTPEVAAEVEIAKTDVSAEETAVAEIVEADETPDVLVKPDVEPHIAESENSELSVAVAPELDDTQDVIEQDEADESANLPPEQEESVPLFSAESFVQAQEDAEQAETDEQSQVGHSSQDMLPAEDVEMTSSAEQSPVSGETESLAVDIESEDEEDYHELFAGPIPKVSVDFDIPFKLNGQKITKASQLDTWSQLIEQSGIGGLNKQLALHSNYVLQGDNVKLIVSEHQRHLFTDSALAAIEESLSDTLQHDVRVTAHIGDVIDTPAAVQHAIKVMRQEHAEKTIQQDSGVKAICDSFSGTVLSETIEPR